MAFGSGNFGEKEKGIDQEGNGTFFIDGCEDILDNYRWGWE